MNEAEAFEIELERLVSLTAIKEIKDIILEAYKLGWGDGLEWFNNSCDEE